METPGTETAPKSGCCPIHCVLPLVAACLVGGICRINLTPHPHPAGKPQVEGNLHDKSFLLSGSFPSTKRLRAQPLFPDTPAVAGPICASFIHSLENRTFNSLRAGVADSGGQSPEPALLWPQDRGRA